MPESAKEKISMFSHVNKEQVICLPDVNNILKVPIILDDHDLGAWFIDRLCMSEILENMRLTSVDRPLVKDSHMQKWRDLAEKSDNITKFVTIALVGKYTTQTDTYTSVIKALNHAGLECNRHVKIKV